MTNKNTYHLKYTGLVFCLAFALGACNPTVEETQDSILIPEVVEDSVNIDLEQYAAAEHLVNPNQLETWLQQDSIPTLLIDIRKQEAYDKGHYDAAHQLWRPDIQAKHDDYGGMMLDKKSLAKLMGDLGAHANTRIVIYDAKGNSDAARLWWMLTVYGHERAYILNGGLLNVDASKINQQVPVRTATTFEFKGVERLDLLADKAAVLAAIEDEQTFILDCRTAEEFTGEQLKKGAARAGRIPTSVNINHSETVAYERQSTFRDYDDLAQRFAAVPRDKKILVYCQSGVRSAHTTFVLKELLGYPDVSNYDGSWIEWSFDQKLPIINENEKTIQ